MVCIERKKIKKRQEKCLTRRGNSNEKIIHLAQNTHIHDHQFIRYKDDLLQNLRKNGRTSDGIIQIFERFIDEHFPRSEDELQAKMKENMPPLKDLLVFFKEHSRSGSVPVKEELPAFKAGMPVYHDDCDQITGNTFMCLLALYRTREFKNMFTHTYTHTHTTGKSVCGAVRNKKKRDWARNRHIVEQIEKEGKYQPVILDTLAVVTLPACKDSCLVRVRKKGESKGEYDGPQTEYEVSIMKAHGSTKQLESCQWKDDCTSNVFVPRSYFVLCSTEQDDSTDLALKKNGLLAKRSIKALNHVLQHFNIDMLDDSTSIAAPSLVPASTAPTTLAPTFAPACVPVLSKKRKSGESAPPPAPSQKEELTYMQKREANINRNRAFLQKEKPWLVV